MSDAEVLTYVIEKAIAGGADHLEAIVHLPKQLNSSQFNEWYPSIIYDHAFAKALWPQPIEDCPYCGVLMFSGLRHYSHCPYADAKCEVMLHKWHLQQLVIAENRFKYLKENT